VVSAGLALFASTLAFDYRASGLPARVGPEPAAVSPSAPAREGAETAAAGEPQGADFSRFTHTNPQHARLPCLLCHQRTDNSARPKRPGHTPCSGCHQQQFADQSNPICAICHTAPPAPALKGFPPLRSFNARFDHATLVSLRSKRGGWICKPSTHRL